MTAFWKNVKTELPTEYGDYLIYRGYFDVATFHPDAKEDWSQWQAQGHKIGGDVKFWTHLPNTPE